MYLKSKLKQTLGSVMAISAIFGLLFFMPVAGVVAQSADDAKQAVCEGIGAATGGSDCEDPPGSTTVDSTVATIINILSIVVAVVSVIMIIVGGLKYITSQGESAGTSSAKNTVIYAIIGLVIVAMAQIIVRFTVDKVTKDPPADPPANRAPK